jgi:hypothetical protein
MAPRNKEYYLNNPNLPTENAKFEYTPAMVQAIKKSTANILHFAENYFYIIDPDSDPSRHVISLYKYQKDALRMLRDNRFNILLASRQVGKTSLFTIYAVWLACFYADENIVVVANKESTAIEIFRRIRLGFEELPSWIKPGVKEWGKTSLELANGSRIGISTTTGSAARGSAITCLILDELAFIEPLSIMEDFWRSVWPTVSRSRKSKVLIASTPNGTGNLFFDLYDGAEKGTNGFSQMTIRWNDVPFRDEKWKKEQIKALGSVESFSQEYDCVFLQKGEASIDIEMFEKLKQRCTDPIYTLDDGEYNIWKDVEEDNIYIAGVDVSEGVGKDYSVINIFNITDLSNIDQVAVYRSNMIAPDKFTKKLYEVLCQWGKPLVAIERNGCGAQVVDNLRNIHNYENIINYGSDIAKRKTEQLGCVNHTNTKVRGIMNMRYWINELGAVKFNDINTVRELKDFVRKPNGTWSARGTGNDDCVMSMLWGLIVLDNDPVKGVCNRYFEISQVDDVGKPRELKMLDYGIKYYERPTNSFAGMINKDDSNTMPVSFGGMSNQDDELSDLQLAGWKFI